MQKIILLLCLLIHLSFSADFPQTHSIKPQNHQKNQTNRYKQLDRNFTLSCDCGEPAELLPYNGEDIPMAKTEPCLSVGCVENFSTFGKQT